MTTEIFSGSCHIATLAQNGDAQAFDFYVKVPKSEFKETLTLTCRIDYPLKSDKTFKVNVYGFHIEEYVNVNVVDIAKQVAKQYQKMWNKNKSLFEGHHIGDLFIESMAIDNGELFVEVGS